MLRVCPSTKGRQVLIVDLVGYKLQRCHDLSPFSIRLALFVLFSEAVRSIMQALMGERLDLGAALDRCSASMTAISP